MNETVKQLTPRMRATSLFLTLETNLLEEVHLSRLLPEIFPVVNVGRVRLDARTGAAAVVNLEAEAVLRRPTPAVGNGGYLVRLTAQCSSYSLARKTTPELHNKESALGSN